MSHMDSIVNNDRGKSAGTSQRILSTKEGGHLSHRPLLLVGKRGILLRKFAFSDLIFRGPLTGSLLPRDKAKLQRLTFR
jgi:hypothetical protein